MNAKNSALGGAALLVVGLFLPIVSFPIVGTVNLFSNGSNYAALALLGLAIVCGFVAASDRLRDLKWPAIAATATVAYLFIRLQILLANMKDELSKSLEGNPFAGIAQAGAAATKTEWGWIVLAVGVGLLLYAVVLHRRGDDEEYYEPNRIVMIAGVVLALVAPALDLKNYLSKTDTATLPASSTDDSLSSSGEKAAEGIESKAISSEQAAYIRENLELYDVDARYFDSILDGRIPGVNFKIKNKGERTLNRVEVTVTFFDKEGKAIAEEDYLPVLVTDSSFGDSDKPLKPNYIYQNEADKMWVAKNVPTEWDGRATAKITAIEFAPK